VHEERANIQIMKIVMQLPGCKVNFFGDFKALMSLPAFLWLIGLALKSSLIISISGTKTTIFCEFEQFAMTSAESFN
jgi:hypothetical protein